MASDRASDGARKRVLYLFPDRSSRAAQEWERTVFWPVYRTAAEDCGLDFDVVNPEHVVLAGGDAYANGERLLPKQDILVYDIRSEPVHEVDLWPSMTLVRSLESIGFWSAIPLAHAVLFNDKFATAAALADAPVPVIPSVRVATGRDIDRLDYQRLVPDDWFPVFIKPASWGRGLGCMRCPDRATLDAVLGLASGSGACILVQPAVANVVADLRVVAVEGEIVAAYDRIPGSSAHVANVSRGGGVRRRAEVTDTVRELIGVVHERFDLPYVCVDLLRTASGELWLSEVELDGAVSALFDDPEAVRRVVGGRFHAYAARLETHVQRQAQAGGSPGPAMATRRQES